MTFWIFTWNFSQWEMFIQTSKDCSSYWKVHTSSISSKMSPWQTKEYTVVLLWLYLTCMNKIYRANPLTGSRRMLHSNCKISNLRMATQVACATEDTQILSTHNTWPIRLEEYSITRDGEATNWVSSKSHIKLQYWSLAADSFNTSKIKYHHVE